MSRISEALQRASELAGDRALPTDRGGKSLRPNTSALDQYAEETQDTQAPAVPAKNTAALNTRSSASPGQEVPEASAGSHHSFDRTPSHIETIHPPISTAPTSHREGDSARSRPLSR